MPSILFSVRHLVAKYVSVYKNFPKYYTMSRFKFLVTTDNHLGYKHDDYLRANDSYNAFEEALKIARDRDVDFVLLGGDLFHVNKPSASVEHKCIRIIRQHMNASNEKIKFTKISGSFSHCPSLNHANFEDTNLNVSHPIITIHGNHDDPTGPNGQSVCEKLATSGLLNYFGALSLEAKIVVKPIVFKRGDIMLAIYGMGFLPDGRLRAAFVKGEVEFEKPPCDTFNILVTHQNRATVNKDRFIPDEYYPSFFHLIIRGHEHEAQTPKLLAHSKVKGLVYQPGSTVATSINVMESLPKKVGIMTVTKNLHYKLDHDLVELKSTRPMIVRNIFREDIVKYAKQKFDIQYVSDELRFFKISLSLAEETITEILKLHNGTKEVSNNSDTKNLPIVRIRIEYMERFERFDENEFAVKYYGKQTANSDIVLFRKQKLVEIAGGEVNVTFNEVSSLIDPADDEDIEHINLSREKRDTIDAMIESYFKDLHPNERLIALSLKEYTDAVKGSLEDGNVIGKVVKTKTDYIMREFEKALSSEEVAEEEFQDDNAVKEWFMNKLRQNNTNFQQVGGDMLDDMDSSDL